MLLSAALDPKVLDETHFSQETYRDRVIVFLQGVLENVVLLVDSEEKLRDALRHAAQNLDKNQTQRVRILVEEIMKESRHFAITCQKPVMAKDVIDTCQTVIRLCDEYDADTAVMHSISRKSLARTTSGVDPRITLLDDYIDSEFEQYRRKINHGLPQLDLADPAMVDKAIFRAICFSSWLRFYDPQIGKANNCRGFYLGIDHILRIWQKSKFVTDCKECSVEIITIVDNSKTTLEDARRTMQAEIVKPLEAAYQKHITLTCKYDPDHQKHSRYLQSATTTLIFDRGFDFIDRRTHRFRECTIIRHDPTDKALSSWLRLQEVCS